MEALLVLVAGATVDLSPITQQLWAHRIAHRVVMVDGQQHIYLANPADIPQVRAWVEQWREGQLDAPEIEPVSTRPLVSLILMLTRIPVTLGVSVLLVLIFGWMQLSTDWLPWVRPGDGLWPDQRLNFAAYLDIGLLAWLKPLLVHFSLMHLVFNGMWWWILGRNIEQHDGSRMLLLLTLLTGLVGNVAQWWYSGPGFGGLSGVTLGLLGWIGWRQYQRKIAYSVPPMLLPVMAGWLLLTMMGDTLVPGLTGIAHGAHLGGLISGMLLATVWPARRPATPNT